MKKHISLTTLFISFFFSFAQAQVYDRKSVQAGESLSNLSYYLFPSFTKATVKFKNGNVALSNMNFNLLICQMQFIDPNGDTLSLAQVEDIDTIAFDSTLFFYNKGYYQVLSTNANTKLVILRKVSYEPVKIGALGLRNESGTGTVDYGSFLDKSGDKHLTLNEDVDINKETSFFLIQPNREMIKANKTGFLSVFSKNRDVVNTYIKENRPNFNSEDDLKKLFDYSSHLL